MKHVLDRRQFVASLGAAGAMMGLGPVMAQGNTLVITTYGGRYEKFWREVLLPPFTQKTGIQTTVDVALGVNWAANLRATGPQKPSYSFVMMNELVGAMLRREGFFEAWPVAKVPNLAKVHKLARVANDEGVTAMVSLIGIAYRKDLVKTPPKDWKDLWTNPEFKGKLGLFAINNTAGYMFVMLMSKIFGSGPFDFDAGFREIEKLKPFPTGDLAGALAVLLTRGEILACPLDVGEVVTMQKRGAPVGFVGPQDGMYMFDQTFCLLKNAPNKDAACAFLDYMLSEDVQIKLAEEFSAVPVNTSVKLPAAVADQLPIKADAFDRIVTFDWVKTNEERAAVTERWNRMVR